MSESEQEHKELEHTSDTVPVAKGEVGLTVPDGTWKMVKKLLGRLDAPTDLSPREKKVALVAYLKDQPGRDRRMGAGLIGLGGAGAVIGALIAFMVDNQSNGLYFLAAFGFAAVMVGQGVQLFGSHRDGVGPMVATILEDRDRAAEQGNAPSD